MISKRIEYSGHADERRALRGITRQEVRWLLARGERSAQPARPDADQRWMARGYLGRREAAVVFLEDAERYMIVTVEWIDGKPRGEED